MNSNHHEDEIFQEKRKPKNPIKFKVELNQEQKEANSPSVTIGGDLLFDYNVKFQIKTSNGLELIKEIVDRKIKELL